MVACTGKEDDHRITQTDPKKDITKIIIPTSIDQSLTNKLKETVKDKDEVTRVRGINSGSDILLAIEVKQINQFNEQEIEKKIKKELEKKYPEANIEVSSDKKIFIEIDELEKKIQNNRIGKKDLEKKYNEIKKLIKDQA
nr:YhcN/YlaJ family sporulation lipoprotein [Aquibacillus albus]